MPLYLLCRLSTNTGLKQGDILSALFFNLHINDTSAYLTSNNNEIFQGEMSKRF